MREILFRGKRHLDGKWVEGYLDHVDGYDAYTISEYFVDESTIGQYTGLKDKNGKRIFEGDIVKRRWNNYDCFIYKVVFDDTLCCFMAQRHRGFSSLDDDFEVIGNIHDNPELLEG